MQLTIRLLMVETWEGMQLLQNLFMTEFGIKKLQTNGETGGLMERSTRSKFSMLAAAFSQKRNWRARRIGSASIFRCLNNSNT